MDQHVCLEATSYCARVVTFLAGKRFRAIVWKKVILHPIRVSARVAALLTCKELLSSIIGACASWDRKLESNNSYSTHNWMPFSRMSQHVLSEMTSCSEGEVAPCAIERFFSGVDGNVYHHTTPICRPLQCPPPNLLPPPPYLRPCWTAVVDGASMNDESFFQTPLFLLVLVHSQYHLHHCSRVPSSYPLIKCWFVIMGRGKSNIIIVDLWETTTPTYEHQILYHTTTVYHASLWNQPTSTIKSL